MLLSCAVVIAPVLVGAEAPLPPDRACRSANSFSVIDMNAGESSSLNVGLAVFTRNPRSRSRCSPCPCSASSREVSKAQSKN